MQVHCRPVCRSRWIHEGGADFLAQICFSGRVRDCLVVHVKFGALHSNSTSSSFGSWNHFNSSSVVCCYVPRRLGGFWSSSSRALADLKAASSSAGFFPL